MAKMKSTKKALLTSALALTLSSSMLVGTTFAWFTDSVTSTGNKIVAGTLKVDLELLDENGSWNSIKASKAPIFNYDNWEPGYTDVKILKVENEGSLALKWKAKFVSDYELSELANVIDVYVNPSETALTYPTDRTVIGADYEYVGTVAEFVNTIEQTTYGTLKADGETGDEAYLGIALKMQESAGNEYQNKKLGDFDIQIVATQLAYEGDSFGTDYDEDAVYPALSTSQKVPANATEPMSLKTEDISVDLPAELLNNLPDDVTELAIAHTEPTVDEDTGVLVFDSVELVDQDGNVVDLSENSVEFTATLPVGDYFDNGMILNVYHDDAQIATAPVVNKEVTYSATHFCEVSLSEKVFITVSFTDGYEKNFTSLKSAMRFGYSEGDQVAITVYEDITEEMDYLEGNIVCGKEGGVTIKNTIVDEWIYCDSTNFTIGEGVTYDATGYASGLFVYGEDCVINGTVLMDCYYQRYADTKLTINAPGSMTVKTETFILRYADGDANAGIYINGDNDDSTVEFKLAVAYFYQGMISAKDATLVVGTYWQTNETDDEGSANLVLDNSKLTVTVNEHNFKATGNSTVTLKNGSVLNVAGGMVLDKELVISEGEATIELNGRTFTNNDKTGDAIAVTGTGVLNLKNGTVNAANNVLGIFGEGQIYAEKVIFNAPYGFGMNGSTTSEKSVAEFVDCEFHITSGYSAAYISAKGTYTFTNCTLEGGEGILIRSGNVTLDGCEIIANGYYGTAQAQTAVYVNYETETTDVVQDGVTYWTKKSSQEGSTGDCVVIVDNSGDGYDLQSVTIKNCTFTVKNTVEVDGETVTTGYAIRYVNKDGAQGSANVVVENNKDGEGNVIQEGKLGLVYSRYTAN